MKCYICIIGKTSSKLAIARRLNRFEDTEYEFENIKLHYPTLSEARKDLWGAYRSLRSDFPKSCGLGYIPKKSLVYDASRAVITTYNS